MDQSLSATLLDDLCTLVGKPLPERAEIRVWGMSGVERVTFPDGTTAVFKYAKEPFDREAQALRAAYQRGLPVPALHATAMQDKWLGMLMDDLGTPVRDADDLDGVAAAVMLHSARPGAVCPSSMGRASLPCPAEPSATSSGCGRPTDGRTATTSRSPWGRSPSRQRPVSRGRRSTRSAGSTPSSTPRASTSGRTAGTSSTSPAPSPDPA